MAKYSLHNRPLGAQLSLVSLFANILALGVAALLMVIAEFTISWLDNTREMAVTTRIIADNARSALVFNDPDFAAKVLDTCNAHPSIRQAVLYRADGSVLTSFERGNGKTITPPPYSPGDNHEYRDNGLLITREIHSEDGMIGALSIRSDLSAFHAKVRWFSLIALLVMILSILLVGPVRRRMQEIITAPLFTLVESVRRVRNEGDYSLRVKTQRKDELGQLINGFNDMLAHIENRDRRLADYNKDLAKEVEERTQSLTETNQKLQREIRERLTIQRELARFKTTLDLTSDGVIMFHPETQEIFYANQGAADLTSIPRETLSKSRFMELLPRADAATLGDTLAALRRPNAGFRTLDSTLHPFADKELSVQIFLQYIEPTEEEGRYLAIIHDISEQKKLERTLTQARDAAQAASQAKGLFLANMSHEIRTPMHAVLGMTQLALNTELDNRQRNYLEKIYNSAKTLLNILNDILDLSKIEADKMSVDKEEIDLQRLIEESSQLMAVSCYAKGLELLIDIAPATPRTISGDSHRLRQILTNLLSNAIKFTDSGHVALRVAPLSRERNGSSRLHFVVEDTGIGITREQIGYLFEPFSQVDPSHTRKFGGTGLGLALCKRLVQLMGGEINGEPRPEGGSSFSFTLPYDQRPVARRARPPLLQGRRILVMDPYPPSRELTEKILGQAGAATSGLHPATRLVQRIGQWDLVLYNLNGADRKKPAILSPRNIGDTPILVMERAASVDASVAWEGAETIPKPLTPRRLAGKLANFFQGRPLDDSPPPATLDDLFTREQASSGLRILLAEDIAINREIAQEFLEAAGHSVLLAENGRQALEILDREVVELVLMDVQMPELDGLEATRTLRQDPRFTDLPIIAMTAHAMPGDRGRCLQAGMNDYLSKPLIAEVMLATIRTWAGNRRGGESTPDRRRHEPRPSTAPIADFREIPGIEAELALKRLLDNEDLFKRMLHRFHEHYHDSPAQLAALIAADDRQQARTLAHGIKGIAASLNMAPLRSACDTLEKRLDSPDADITEALDDFSGRVGEVVQGIERWQAGQGSD